VGLAHRRAARCGRLSGGQQRRLDVALALIGDPELVFLDEPTTGFDPAARQSAWEVIAGLRDLGKTIFLTTHYMEEAERLADQIAVIAAGRMAAWAKARNIDLPDIQVIRPTLEDTYLRLIRVTVGSRHQPPHLVAHQFGADLRCFWRNSSRNLARRVLPRHCLAKTGRKAITAVRVRRTRPVDPRDPPRR